MLKAARVAAGLTQQQAASRLGLSQPYYSQLESGARPISPPMARKAFRKLKLPAQFLPLPALASGLDPIDPHTLASALGALGYPGFSHLARLQSLANPAELVIRALVHTDLETRLIEPLPWLLAAFDQLDWAWLVSQSRLLNLQNRVGFVAALALQLKPAQGSIPPGCALDALEASRLAAEGTLCRESMPPPERRWVRAHRPALAAHWNLLTTLTVDQLTHAA